MKAPSKVELAEIIGKKFKKPAENIKIMEVKSRFGGGRTTGIALIYDNLENRKRFETMKYLRKVEFKR